MFEGSSWLTVPANQSENTPSEREQGRIVREMYDAWNSHDVAQYAKVLHSSCSIEWTTRRRSASGDLLGSESACDAMRGWLQAFPDIHFYVEAMMASSSDRVVTSWLATATRMDGGLEIPGCSVVGLEGEKIVHVWTYWDKDQMLRHLSAPRQRGSDGHVPARSVPAAS